MFRNLGPFKHLSDQLFKVKWATTEMTYPVKVREEPNEAHTTLNVLVTSTLI